MKKQFKRLLATILTVIFLLSVCPVGLFSITASAATSGKCGVNVYWNYNTSTKTLTISGTGTMDNYYDAYNSIANTYITTATWSTYFNTMTSVVLGDGVTSIGDSAFYGCTGLTSVTIGNSVTSIGRYAFYGCESLTSITIPDSVTSIGGSVFRGCTSLTTITIPYSVTSIGDYAFFNTPWYNNQPEGPVYAGKVFYKYKGKYPLSVIIKDGTLGIAVSAFYGCTGLTSITIPDSVTSIGEWAFYGCTGLTSVTIPDSVTSIGEWAFSGCTGLTSVTIGNSVTSIENYAFYRCTSLTDVYYSGTKEQRSSMLIGSYNNDPLNNAKWHYLSGQCGENVTWVYNKSTKTLTISGTGKMSYYSYTYNSTVGTYITSAPWSDYYNTITTVIIGDGVTSIGDYAFSGCESLTSITIPDSVTSIRSSAFSGCTGLESIVVNSGNSVYHSAGNCLIETDSKTLILGCKNSIIPNDGSVTSIGDRAFSGCTGLTSITIPDSVTSIGKFAFENCTGLKSVTIGNSVTSIGERAFYWCTGLTSVTIGNSVTSIGVSAFRGCTGLTSITIPDSVTSIGGSAFRGCTGLTSVTIGNSVTSIGVSAFEGCRGLTTITIPDSVTSIGRYAFNGCTYLTDIYYSGTKEQRSSMLIGDYNAPLNNADWHISGQCGENATWVYNTSTKTLTISGTGEMSNYSYTYNSTAGTYITSAPWSAYFNTMTSVVLGDGVTSIGDYAFYRCTGLTSVTIPDSVISIGRSAFEGCENLTDIYYSGTKGQRSSMLIGYNNAPLNNAEWHYSLISIIAGDATGDGAVDSKDLVRLKKYLAGQDVEYSQANADCNGDGKVDTKDLVRLKKYLAGQNVTLGA